jgi:hypothetical protein
MLLQIMVYRYDDEEWSSFVEPLDSRWSRKETDYLLDLVAQFDSRFLPVADRYQVMPPQQSPCWSVHTGP